MLQLAWPYVLLALPLPLLARWLPARGQTPAAAIRLPFFAQLQTLPAHQKGNRWALILAFLAWSFLVIACSRPQWLGEPVELPLTGRDLMLAVDISGSMNTPDMTLAQQNVTRLTTVKAIAGEFISRRQGDRIGLILFGSQAYLQAPLTFDRGTVRTFLQEAEIGLAGKETAIGDAIALALKRLRQAEANSTSQAVLILLTDGANNTGAISPLRAAALAAQEGLRIYTIGIGAEQMVTQGIFGTNRINPSADLDEVTLSRIAAETSGQYFRARSTTELEQIYQLLDQLEPNTSDQDSFRPTAELYPWPLTASMVLMLALLSGWPNRLAL